ncbi:tyrosine-type recombinase/integrase [Noviherbaspirillum sp. 1P10PC]|uniref:tyrosine-type recombinase/integrase n=1 Tax=Noviherbaspirillum sp. 1P10PC TaxID=3132292 RepID=UPI0039A2E402
MKYLSQEDVLRRAVLDKVAAANAKQAEIAVGIAPGLRIVGYSGGKIDWGVRCRDPTTKKKVRISVGDGTMASAIAEAFKVIALVKSGQSPRAGRITVADYFDEQVYPWVLRERTSARDYKGRFDKHVRHAIGARAIADVQPNELLRLAEGLPSHLAVATRNRISALVKTIFRRAFDTGVIDRNPAVILRMQQENNERRRIASDDEIRALYAAIDAEPQPSFPGLLVRLLLSCGLRMSEALNARFDNLSPEGCFLAIPRGKNGKSRLVPLSAEAQSVIQELHTYRRNEFLFPGRTGGHMTRPTRAYNRILKRAGIEGLCLHDLRRTACSIVVNAGVPVLDASRFLGHSSINITAARYAVLSEERLMATAKVVSDRLAFATADTASSTSQVKEN